MSPPIRRNRFSPRPGEGGTRLLTQEQDPLNVIGQVYGRVQIFDQEIRGGRMLVDTPLINPQDSRMVPNTFEGVQLVSLPDKDRMYDYAAGYLWTIKPRDSNDFIPMSDALAGADVVDRQVPFGMVKFRPLPGLTAIAMDYYMEDFINTSFGQVEYNFQPSKQHPNFTFGANVIGQSSVGANLLGGPNFETYQFSGKGQMSYMGWTLFAAGSITGDERNIASPFGAKPNYTDMQQVSFDNANEKAIGGSIAYDLGYAFGQYGLSGLSVGAWYTQGWDAINGITGAAIADRRELDIWAQYRPSSGPLRACGCGRPIRKSGRTAMCAIPSRNSASSSTTPCCSARRRCCRRPCCGPRAERRALRPFSRRRPRGPAAASEG